MNNIPNVIYVPVEESKSTWNKERQNENDIVYVRHVKENHELKVNYLKMFLNSIERQSVNFEKDTVVFRSMQQEYDMIAALLAIMNRRRHF